VAPPALRVGGGAASPYATAGLRHRPGLSGDPDDAPGPALRCAVELVWPPWGGAAWGHRSWVPEVAPVPVKGRVAGLPPTLSRSSSLHSHTHITNVPSHTVGPALPRLTARATSRGRPRDCDPVGLPARRACKAYGHHARKACLTQACLARTQTSVREWPFPYSPCPSIRHPLASPPAFCPLPPRPAQRPARPCELPDAEDETRVRAFAAGGRGGSGGAALGHSGCSSRSAAAARL
jgi:hypothetical protein